MSESSREKKRDRERGQFAEQDPWEKKRKKKRAGYDYVTYATTQVDSCSVEPPRFIISLM